jgi:diguanylate cyclase (GGDEF)-like protein
VVGRPFADLVHPDDRALVASLEENVFKGQQGATEVRLRTVDQDYRWVDVQMRPETDETGVVASAVANWRDAEAIHEARADLERRAAYDDLTGALRREGALARLEALGRPTRRTGVQNAVLFCDVDDFKAINDAHGHAVGDEVLRTIYRVIRSIVRDDDAVARFGGDEFLVILTGIRHLEDAGAIAEKIRQAVRDPSNVVAGLATPTVSLGVTLLQDGESADASIARADQAMYAAKQTGSDAVVCLDPPGENDHPSAGPPDPSERTGPITG